MMLRRAAPSAAGPSTNSPVSSGPRWRTVAIIRASRAGSGGAPVSETKPAMPHMLLLVARRSLLVARRSWLGKTHGAAADVRELLGDERRDALGGAAVEELTLLQ